LDADWRDGYDRAPENDEDGDDISDIDVAVDDEE
jgi:hypothetical protein